MKLLQTKTLGAAEETDIRFLNASFSHRGSSKKKKNRRVESENRRGFTRKKKRLGGGIVFGGDNGQKKKPFRGQFCGSGSPESH